MKYILGFKKVLDNTLRDHKNEAGLMTNNGSERNLVEHGGMLEILARFALLEDQYNLEEAS